MIKSGWRVIVSRMSGGGKALADWPRISKLLNRAGVEYSERITERSYHAIELAEEAVAEGYRKILVLGGDGALHEVINGLFMQEEVSPSEITLGLITVGSGNDWARMHNIPKNYKAAVDIIAKADKYVRYQDVAKVSTLMDGKPYCRYMINIGGLGFDADVCRRFDLAKARGKASDRQYYKCLMNGFLFYRCLKFKIRVDGHLFFEGPALSVAMGIGKYCGGGMMQTPDAIIDDGLINLTVVKKFSKLKFLEKIPSLFKGTIYQYKDQVVHTMGKTLEIEAAPYSFIEVDGETVGRTPVKVEVIHSAVKVVSCMREPAAQAAASE